MPMLSLSFLVIIASNFDPPRLPPLINAGFLLVGVRANMTMVAIGQRYWKMQLCELGFIYTIRTS